MYDNILHKPLTFKDRILVSPSCLSILKLVSVNFFICKFIQINFLLTETEYRIKIFDYKIKEKLPILIKITKNIFNWFLSHGKNISTVIILRPSSPVLLPSPSPVPPSPSSFSLLPPSSSLPPPTLSTSTY